MGEQGSVLNELRAEMQASTTDVLRFAKSCHPQHSHNPRQGRVERALRLDGLLPLAEVGMARIHLLR